jgi:hypothetical protein
VIVRHDHKATIARYGGDFRTGFLNQVDQIPCTHNLVNIGLDCHPVRGSIAGYRVVRFAVEPFLFQHEHAGYKTIKTCLGNRTHMSRGVIQSSQRVAVEEICYLPPQCDKERVGCGMELAMGHLLVGRSGSSSSAVVFLTSMSAALIIWICRGLNSYYGSSAVAEDYLEEIKGWLGSGSIGWSLRADCFRPPCPHPTMYCVFCGSGFDSHVAVHRYENLHRLIENRKDTEFQNHTRNRRFRQECSTKQAAW